MVVGLGRPGHFLVTKDTKALIRRGVPINLRGTVSRRVARLLQYLSKALPSCQIFSNILSNIFQVWRAVIMNRIRGNVEPGQHQDYYQVSCDWLSCDTVLSSDWSRRCSPTTTPGWRCPPRPSRSSWTCCGPSPATSTTTLRTPAVSATYSGNQTS